MSAPSERLRSTNGEIIVNTSKIFKLNRNLVITYSPVYLDWILGEAHPTNPVRARLATDLLEEKLPGQVTVIDPAPREERANDIEVLLQLHDRNYVNETLAGHNGEWRGTKPEVANAGLAMFSGTVRAVELILNNEAKVIFNPQGAKHHARFSSASGFCIFNDMAYAALALKRAGLKPLYLDWDIHAGDGVQHMLKGHQIPTISIHNGRIYPSDPELQSLDGSRRDVINEDELNYNFNLLSGDGDDYFMEAIDKARAVIENYKPDVILLAAGADGHTGTNNLNVNNNYTAKGFKYAAEMVAEQAGKHSQGRVIIGGAGGYQPLKETPETWALVVSTIFKNIKGN